MRRIGRLRREASPSKVAVTGWPPTTPIISREPVPALPKSSTSSGSCIPPMPTPTTRQRPSPSRVTWAPRARAAAAVRSTSSPSRRPSTRVSPMASNPRIIARWEIDLSPGGFRDPCRGPPGCAVTGCGSESCDPGRVWGSRSAPGRPGADGTTRTARRNNPVRRAPVTMRRPPRHPQARRGPEPPTAVTSAPALYAKPPTGRGRLCHFDLVRAGKPRKDAGHARLKLDLLKHMFILKI